MKPVVRGEKREGSSAFFANGSLDWRSGLSPPDSPCTKRLPLSGLKKLCRKARGLGETLRFFERDLEKLKLLADTGVVWLVKGTDRELELRDPCDGTVEDVVSVSGLPFASVDGSV
jgi:hypothetical protein